MHAHTHTHAHMHAHAHKMIKTCKKMVCMEHVLSASLGFTVHFQFLALCNSAQRGGMLYALSKSTYTQTNTDQCTQTHHICVLHICICQVTVYLCVIAESVLPVTAPTGWPPAELATLHKWSGLFPVNAALTSSATGVLTSLDVRGISVWRSGGTVWDQPSRTYTGRYGSIVLIAVQAFTVCDVHI